MKPTRIATALALAATLSGCAYEGPAASGASLRAIMASQVIPPQPHADKGADGAAAVAAYANYKQSYVAPTPQGDSAMVGTKK